MQKTTEHTRRNRASLPTVDLLIHERNKGKSLRQLGQMFGISHEQARKILAKHSSSRVTFVAEHTVAARLGYPVAWLVQLRKEGVTKPTKPGGRWLYSEEQVRQIPSLIARMRSCERCSQPRPIGYRKFCRECSQNRKKHYYSSLSPEEKIEHREKSLAWRKANPEKWKEIWSRARKKSRSM
jgi:hypothetical protein